MHLDPAGPVVDQSSPAHPLRATRTAGARLDWRTLRIGLGWLALLTLAMFLDALIAPGSRVLGAAQTDLAQQFLPWREFGFG